MLRSQNPIKSIKTTEGWSKDGCSEVPPVLEMSASPLRSSEIEYDDLTGLYQFVCLEKAMQRLNCCCQLPVSIITGDLNGLKNMNSTLGYHAGNKLLIEVAKILRSCSTNESIVSRHGSDGFVILLQQTSSEKAQWICKRIVKAYDKYVRQQEYPACYPSISLGHATKTNNGESIENTIEVAEELMNMRKLLEQKSTRSFLVSSLKITMHEKCLQTAEHAGRVVLLAREVGKALKLTDKQMVELELLSLLHDIGKLSIDNTILSKSGKLTDDEWLEIKKHPEVGYRITHASSDLMRIAEYILCHHERYDGTGYPNGLLGESIPLLSRIISVVDAYDAMTEERPYRIAMSHQEALDEISKNAGTQFDPAIAKLFLRVRDVK